MAAGVVPQIVFPLFDRDYHGLVHGTVSRYGGCSKHPFDSNNISYGVGDIRESVEKNRHTIKEKFGITALASANQVHGDTVYRIARATGDDIRAEACDALITDQMDVGLLIGHADCQAVLLYDPVRRVIGAVHSGWRGSVLDIIGKTVAALEREFGSRRSNLRAAVGPSLGPCCAEFINYKSELPAAFHGFQVKDNLFDFWKITQYQLQRSGVEESHIHNVGICTSCSRDFFSYRRACRNKNGVTGRNGSLIAMVETG